MEGERRTIVEVQPASAFGEGNGTDFDLAETKPGEDDGQGEDALKPEGGIALASVGKLLSGPAAIIDEEDELSPDQSHSRPSEEAVSPLEVIVEPIAHARVGKYKHHQE